jgi:hypothetical protein
MNVKRKARVAVITASVGISALVLCTEPVSAVPLDPPPSPTSPAPDQPPPTGQIALPQSGGSQHGGHPLPQQPPPGTP